MKPQQKRAIAVLETTLVEVRAAVVDCLTKARACTPETDEFGQRRSREFQDATSLLKMAAELGLAIAKINGEFRHDITVAKAAALPTP